MPRRGRDEAVTERVRQRLADQAERRREAAQRGAQTRRQRREEQAGEPQAQPAAERATRAHRARRSPPRAHADMVTVALRGPLAGKLRGLAENTGLSLAKLLGDMVLAYEGQVNAGYAAGTLLAEWSAEQAG